SAQFVIDEATVALPLAGIIDIAAEVARLKREQQKLQGEIRKIDDKLANAQFLARAPEEVVEEQRERRVDFVATVERLSAALARISASG
ncbi:MAG: hypothetical protein KDJ41_13265, partial [Hyphomicrobiaceae bacterium]|nr:hypothetical protein [Hyphomicrobiaceae bacterium]